MCSFRDVVVFVAGAEFFHTLSHVFINYFVVLPLHTKAIEITHSMNSWAIGINAIITIVLLLWASRLGKKRT